jgi:hypothetical protein
MMWCRALLIVFAAWLELGCAFFASTKVEHVASSVDKPSNVAFYVAVSDKGEPVPDLLAGNFKIFENDQQVASEQVGLALLDRGVAAQHRLLLLLDLGGAPSEELKSELAAAVSGFLDKVRPTQSVTVYAFDGGQSLRLIGEFPQSVETGADLSAIASYTPSDPSRNLNGAVESAVDQLKRRISQGGKPVRVGTLVVLARGPDVAARIPSEQLSEKLDTLESDLFSIGIGAKAEPFVEDLGRDGVVLAQSEQTLGIAFDEMGTKVVKAAQRYYLISYCSPSRAGVRRTRLEVHFTTLEGDEKTASIERDFDSTGFGPGCDPNAVPRFLHGTLEPGSGPEPAAAKQPSPVSTPEPEPEEEEEKPEPAAEPKKPTGGGKPTGGEKPAGGENPADGGPVAPPDAPGYE